MREQDRALALGHDTMNNMPNELFIAELAGESGCFFQPLPAHALAAAKRAFSTRRVDLGLAAGLELNCKPRAGDLVLAEIEGLGQHRRLEDIHGRRAMLNQGDRIVVAFGDRYAPDQFEAHVPGNLLPCALVAGGGVAARVVQKSEKVRAATRILPIGLLVDAIGRRLNLRDFAIAANNNAESAQQDIRAIAVIGSSMNAGKTTTIAAMVRGAVRTGQKVAVIKVTGTGSGGDLWAQKDAGASLVLDFTDAGFATTHRLTDAQRLDAFQSLLARCRRESGIDTIFVEVADGLLFGETERLVLAAAFRREIDHILFAAADAMGALHGERWLVENGLTPRALSGAFTASPIAAEEVRARSSCPVLTREELIDGALTDAPAIPVDLDNIA